MTKRKLAITASEKAVDPALAELFSSSAGPVTAPPKSRYRELVNRKQNDAANSTELPDSTSEEESGEGSDGDSGCEGSKEGAKPPSTSASDEEHDGEGSSGESDEDDHINGMQTATGLMNGHHEAKRKPDRKRKRSEEDNADLETKYLQKLAEDDTPPQKRPKSGSPQAKEAKEQSADSSGEEDKPLLHESLSAGPTSAELDKAARTVFLSNVSTEAVTSRSAKKILLAHLSTVLDKSATGSTSIESLRFRSIPFSTAAIPKRAAFITKSLMSATTKSCNAYAVYSDAAAARKAMARLNGTVVLDRHLRVDSVAHPAALDHRRCAFVGNLGFVDDETVLSSKVDTEGNETTEKRKRTKTPMDVEEGLWRVFGKEAGKVESVRVVRDAATRVGKGFAYVQFYDTNSVEAALLLAGKKFPPMLPRALRVSRCKAPQKTARAIERSGRGVAVPGKRQGHTDSASRKGNKSGSSTGYVPKPTAEEQTLAGRAGKWLGKSAAARVSGKKTTSRDAKPGKANDSTKNAGTVFRTPEDIVFEGRRASAKDGKPKDLKFKSRSSTGRMGGKKRLHKPSGHGAKRAAKWKAQAGGKK